MSKIMLAVSLILLAISWGIYFNLIGSSAGVMVIHFSSERGIDFLGDRGDVFGILILVSGIAIMNLGFGKAFSGREKFLERLFYFSSAAISLLLLITLAVILSIN